MKTRHLIIKCNRLTVACMSSALLCLYVSIAFATEPPPELSERFEAVELDDNSDSLAEYNKMLEEGLRRGEQLEARDRARAAGLCEGPDETPEICTYRATEYVFGAVSVPKHAAPFLVQVARSDFFLSASNVRALNPGRQDWEIEHVCGGTLIDKQWVLTAAHCFSTQARVNRPTIHADEFSVRLDVGNINETTSDKIEIEAIFLHPDYDVNPTQHDIALVKIKTEGMPLVVRDYVNLMLDNDMGGAYVDTAIDPNEDYAMLIGDSHVQRLNLRTDAIDQEQRFEQPAGSPRNQFHTDAVLAFAGNVVIRHDLARWGRQTAFDHGSLVDAAIYMADKNRLLTLNRERQQAKLWESNAATVLGTFDVSQVEPTWQNPSSVIKSILASPNRLITLHAPHWTENDATPRLSLWDIETQRLISTQKYNSSLGVIEAEAVPLISFEYADNLIVLNSATGQLVQKIDLKTRDNTVWFEDGRSVVSVDANYRVRIVDGATGRRLAEFAARGAQLNASHPKPKINYHPQSGRLVILNKIGQLQVWDTRTQRLLLSEDLKLVNDVIHSQFFNAGKSLLIWVEKGRSHIWNLETGGAADVFEHSLPVASVRVSEDEQKLITQSAFGTAEIWDIQSAKPDLRIYHGGALKGVRYLKKQNSLLTWDGQGRIKTWNLRTGEMGFNTVHIDRNDRFTPQAIRPNAQPTLISTIQTSKSRERSTENLMTFGWGKTKQVSTFQPSAVLMTASLELLSPEACRALVPSWEFLTQTPFKDTVFCGYDVARKTCKGDSGGPVIDMQSVVGIVSAGSGQCKADNMPGLYTRVDAYKDWITSIVCARERRGSYVPKPCAVD